MHVFAIGALLAQARQNEFERHNATTGHAGDFADFTCYCTQEVLQELALCQDTPYFAT